MGDEGAGRETVMIQSSADHFDQWKTLALGFFPQTQWAFLG